MDKLKNFSKKDMVEQITVLEEIKNEKPPEAIPVLMRLCRDDSDMDSIQLIIRDTLRTLLSENEEKAVEGLLSDNMDVQRLCIQICGQNRFKSSISVFQGLADSQQDEVLLFDTLSALSSFGASESVEIFRRYISHPISTISALCIEMVGKCGDVESIEALGAVVDTAESDELYEACDISTVNAIEALGSMDHESAISFLVSSIHHRNATARRLIQQELVKKGTGVLPYLIPVFEQEDVDQKISAANVLRRIGGKKAGDILINAIDTGAADDPNIRYVIYETLGQIRYMKGLICLMDGLLEENEMILTAVVSSLNEQVNPGVIKKFLEIDNTDSHQSRKLLKAIVSSQALSLFELLYNEGSMSNRLIKTIIVSNDSDIIAVFRKQLALIEGDKPKKDIKRLDTAFSKEKNKRVLAVDDSSAMLLFYKNVVSDLGIDLITAGNGKEALDFLEKGDEFDLILTDMNMPVMDGIELTQTVRNDPILGDIPIVMVTTESEGSQRQMAEKVGVRDFIMKPFSAEKLQEKINAFL